MVRGDELNGTSDRAPIPLGRLGRSAGFAWRRLRRQTQAGAHLAAVHRVPWPVWLVLAASAIGLAALLADAPSVAWAEGLPRWLRSALASVTNFGQSQWVLVPSGVLVLAIAMGDWTRIEGRVRAAFAEIAALASYVFLAVGVAAILANLAKQIIGRARPMIAADGGLSFDPFSFDYANASFPSGHATTAGAALVALAFVFRRLRPVVVTAGLVIAFSRVAVGAHFPSDVVVGLCLGAAVAYGAARFLARRRFVFRINSAGRIAPITRAVARQLRRPGGARSLLAGWRRALFAARRSRG